MRVKKHLTLLVLSLGGLPGYLAAQATVEHSAISGATSTLAGAAGNAAKAIDGALQKLDGTLDAATKRAAGPAQAKTSAAKNRASAAAPAAPPAEPLKPARVFEDPAGIKAGLSYADLLSRFGEPAMQITGDNGEQTLFYSRKDGRGQTQVRVAGGQVRSVDAGDKPVDAAAIE